MYSSIFCAFGKPYKDSFHARLHNVISACKTFERIPHLKLFYIYQKLTSFAFYFVTAFIVVDGFFNLD